MQIGHTATINNLAGLENLSNIDRRFVISNNYELDNLTGLENLTTIGADLDFNLTGLTSLEGLNNLESIGGYLNISNSETLTNLSSFQNLVSIGNFMTISGTAISNFNGLENLNQIGGALYIGSNSNLDSLNGLENLDGGSIINLYITSNPLLTKCAVQSICDYISSPNGIININNNAEGCNNRSEVEEACNTVFIPNAKSESGLFIYPNPATSKLFISANNGIEIKDVKIYNQIGQIVMDKKEFNISIDISSLNQGIYFIEIISDNLIFKDKLVIKK